MHNTILKRKEKIIITAIDLIDEVGANGFTTKEIAKRQDITEAAIYKQFDSKKDIVIAVLDRYAIFDELIRNTIFDVDNDISWKDGILYFARAYAEYYYNYPQITTPMFSFDIFRYEEDANKKMSKIIENRYKVLFDLIAKGSETGDIPQNINKQALVDAIFGVIWSTTLVWKMDSCKFDLKERMLSAVETILKDY